MFAYKLYSYIKNLLVIARNVAEGAMTKQSTYYEAGPAKDIISDGIELRHKQIASSRKIAGFAMTLYLFLKDAEEYVILTSKF